MVDAVKLRGQYRTAVMACLGVTAVPFLLSAVAFMLAASPDPGQPADDPVMLGIFGLLALSPLLTVAIVRRIARNSLARAAESPIGVEGALMIWSLTEYALWEVSSLLGFVGFVLTGSVVFFATCIAFTLGGYAFSFPRWSRWEALLTDLGLVPYPGALTVG